METKKIQKRLFGTNGVRGIVGKDLTPELVLSIGEAFGTMRNGRIAVGRDTRTSGETLAYAVKSGLMAVGCDVTDCGILPTPALQYLVKNHFDGGAMITASHNPPEYNGVKIIESDGTEMGDEETIKLEQRIFDHTYSTTSWEHVGHETIAPHFIEEYVTAIADYFPGKPGAGITVVVDPGSGPACSTTPDILTRLGCRVLTINGIMDGTFPGRLPEPSQEGLKGLAALVVSSGAAFGVAHDGDADRAVFIDEKGQFVEENQEFALVADHICHQKKGVIVTPVSTSQMVEIVAKKNNCTVTYTPVGSIYVARTMRSLIEKGSQVIFGGEGNGGLIFPDHQFCRDGGMTAAMMVAILASRGQKLSGLLEELPKRHMIKDKISASGGAAILEALKSAYSHGIIDQTDGVKIFRNNSWALVRASGTEPLIRIIIDADDDKQGRALRDELMETIRNVTKNNPDRAN
ncbi:MAG: phosphoglucosamine mutase [Methanomicrobiales archaeon HGW-Methanomicrobiales-1]|jgi:phosphomannomutase/phosphoglucomutase|nr:MAG: phosphoglucosamine mutase [Methanomicrobiales archaeon HGW-Methanomicrobiales-1]